MSDPLDRLVMISQHVHNQKINKSTIPRGMPEIPANIQTNFSRPVPGGQVKSPTAIKPSN
ncbi:hypothetical protein WICANDRAFT_90698 [Wickerhamomyces anomalus NRRL Y-366-8]|uniref:Uncharacterized protein n=1 Tax=Wickerhamomyces anomalus (strain ATCC 58044 / CBS 1984 / NCYC 433 / NRRL Y-366-8) TaxID=683960 RepID=A0A1E3P7N7_WICAA|nr:uncharacterized protein WICANDRAFT_90698 [Wickerhamomyces anomalus NRRL Y-366-8]ODQ61310.1 hypothetical protein WICANDRAFT_90698 [Wickerhamomyces anomalus NRRL Y-366-8]